MPFQKGVRPARNDHELPGGDREVRQRVDLPRRRVAHRPARARHRIGRWIVDLEPLVAILVHRVRRVVEHLGDQQVGDRRRRHHGGEVPHQIGRVVVDVRIGRRARKHDPARQRHRRKPRHVGVARRRQLVRHPQPRNRRAVVDEPVGDVDQAAVRRLRRPGHGQAHVLRLRRGRRRPREQSQQPRQSRPPIQPLRLHFNFLHARLPLSKDRTPVQLCF